MGGQVEIKADNNPRSAVLLEYDLTSGIAVVDSWKIVSTSNYGPYYTYDILEYMTGTKAVWGLLAPRS